MTSTEDRRVYATRTTNSAVAQPQPSVAPGGAPTPVVRREKFHTDDAAQAKRFFTSAYEPGWQVPGLTDGAQVSHDRAATDGLTIDDVQVSGHVDLTMRQGKCIVVVQPRGGAVTCAGDERRDLAEPILLSGRARTLMLDDASFEVISVDARVIREVAAELPVALPAEMRFVDRRPRSAAGLRAWHRTLDYVTAMIQSPDTPHQPLIVAAAARAMAATLLDSFASNVERPAGDSREPASSLNRALAFIHRNAMSDIGIHEIAREIHLTPRAVQYLFRRELETTPTDYLRQVRLHRAHQDLIAGDRTHATVGAIATKWGFAHTGRFAVLYRQTYGQSPHTTLRG
jgi:AraC-like DNA-binding protein